MEVGSCYAMQPCSPGGDGCGRCRLRLLQWRNQYGTSGGRTQSGMAGGLKPQLRYTRQTFPSRRNCFMGS
eukprot:scaffold881_cov387-Prasinococcus_capsulatus_cf.AAC.3